MKIGKRYYWETKIGGKFTFRSGLLISVSPKQIARLQDKAGFEWEIPVHDLSPKPPVK